MKKTIFRCLGAAAVAFVLQFTTANVLAADWLSPCGEIACDPCDPVCGSKVGTKAGQWFLNGHLEAGFFANSHGATSTYGGPGFDAGLHQAAHAEITRGANGASGNTDRLQNTRLTGGQVNQVYLSMGKAVDGRRGLDIGGTVDFTWGSDAYRVQTAGMEYAAGHGAPDNRWGKGDYFASFAQAYAEIAYDRWNIKAGKFYAPFGSSPYKSTDNFFYSWASTAYIAPTVGGGAYATYKVNDKLAAVGGWVMPSEIGESSKNNAFLGGLIWTPGKRLNVVYAFAVGENTYGGNGLAPYDYFVHSLVTTTQLSDRLKYVFDWTYFQIRVENPGVENIFTYGLNNELIYQASSKWAFGTRFGILNDPGNNDWYTVALGANWTPNKWLTVKPEVRYDWIGGATAKPFNSGNNTYQTSGGLSAVVKF